MSIVKAIRLKDVRVEDPDSCLGVELAVYKDPQSGSLFAVDAAFVDQVSTFIPSIYNSGTLQLDACDEDEENDEQPRDVPTSEWSTEDVTDAELPEDTVRAAISPAILSKADRLFRNDDAGVFVELLQNSRRAGASTVRVSIETIPGNDAESQITLHDNGRGIENFQNLLTLGGSGWDASVQRTEDPAGMGFFSLCHSDVEVASGNQSVLVTREVFLGESAAQITPTREFVAGTRVVFARTGCTEHLRLTLKRVSEFGPLQVIVNGEELPRHDFLEGALHREVIDGVEVGFAQYFEHHFSHLSSDENWNFHGLRISKHFTPIKGLLCFDEQDGWSSGKLHARFNVLETGRVKLQLPDRRAIVEDEQLSEFERKVRAAGFRFLATLGRHALTYREWQEARDLGVDLVEASPLLKTWHAECPDENLEPFFGSVETALVTNTDHALLVPECMENRHTFEAALASESTFGFVLYQEAPAFEGYSWYDTLPRLIDTSISADGISYQTWAEEDRPRPQAMELAVTLTQAGRSRVVRLPIAIHVTNESAYDRPDDALEFVAIQNSPWDNADLHGPFDITSFLLHATFCSSDNADADSWETQQDEYETLVERQVNKYFRGPRTALLAILRSSLPWEALRYAAELRVREIRFHSRKAGTQSWQIELLCEEEAPEPRTA
jgi:hypothetical protein